jgi:hypothetical protein
MGFGIHECSLVVGWDCENNNTTGVVACQGLVSQSASEAIFVYAESRASFDLFTIDKGIVRSKQ